MIREQDPGIEFKKVWRDKIFDLLSPEKRNIFVLNVEMGVARSNLFVDLFTTISHYRNLTVMYMCTTCLIRVQNRGQ